MLNQVKDTSSLERGFKDTSSPCAVGGNKSVVWLSYTGSSTT